MAGALPTDDILNVISSYDVSDDRFNRIFGFVGSFIA